MNDFQAESSLPPEPKNGCPEPITKIRFRKPTGDFLERTFTVDTKLKVRAEKYFIKLFPSKPFSHPQILLNFATANGFSPEEFKIISRFPQRDVSLMPSCCLQFLNIFRPCSSQPSIPRKPWRRWNYSLRRRWCSRSDKILCCTFLLEYSNIFVAESMMFTD